jgi:hypothetical protein
VFAPFGLVAVAAAFAARPWVLVTLPITFLVRRADLSLRVVLGSQALPLLLSLVMGAAVWGLRVELDNHVEAAALLPILVIAGAGIYATLVYLTMPQLVGTLTRRLGTAAATTVP